MKNYILELAKNNNTVVPVEKVAEVVELAKKIGIVVCGGAFLDGNRQIIYREHPAPVWVGAVETLLRSGRVEVGPAMADTFIKVCEALNIELKGVVYL
jgi:hypothetical protein